MKRTMRLVRRSSVSGVREAAAKAMAFCQKETEAHVEQDCTGDEIPGRSWEDHGKIPILILEFWIVQFLVVESWSPT
ncbi:unnamed protein product [Cladocopium goreaui]|uniref:Uncharacterized protein n=1 Tax=Cladocopium goreaui TaxID=2562237 RepID=A0A9P1GR63_9DINO|nr:unnamed protein product [Cladocopium goreaui]